MSETITEMILPGTYIEVRAEGLLTIGGIATGNVGVLGSAEKGNGGIEILSSFEEGRAKFGDEGTWDPSDPEATQGNLSLVRALRLLFDNGASTVYAQRVYDPGAARPATHQLVDGIGNPVATLAASSPGGWGNRLEIRVEEAEDRELVAAEEVDRGSGSFVLSAQKLAEPASAGASIGRVTVVDQGLSKRYQLKLTATSSEVVQVNPANRQLTFATAPSPAAEVRASYWVPADSLRQVTLRYGNVQEVHVVPSVAYLLQRLANERRPSTLVTVDDNGVQAPGNVLPGATAAFVPFTGGENGGVKVSDYRSALDRFAEEDIQLLTVAGLGFSKIKAAVLGHVEKTENSGRERIAVLGADASEVDAILENANEVADKRVVLVAPGLTATDPETEKSIALPPYLTAAAVAGRLGALAPHISATNKTLASIDDLDAAYNYGQLKALVQGRVLAVEKKRGIRVVKGITSDDGAFRQISVRRIVDYVKQGTRLGCNQYIGKLNNRRVRENLRTTLDGFLADLVTREFLTGYKLTVFADRAMEIRGEVQVIMDLKPTFSIDVIRVTMNLS